MHAARLTSPRLQRTLAALRAADGWITSLELCRNAAIVAQSATVAELRSHGFGIDCRQRQTMFGRVWEYRLVKEPARVAKKNEGTT